MVSGLCFARRVNADLELWLFEYPGLYPSVPASVRAVAAARGIATQEMDLTQPDARAEACRVTGYPTLILRQRGQEIGRTVQVWQTVDHLNAWIDERVQAATVIDHHSS